MASTTSLTVGTYTYYAVAADSFGNTSGAAQISITSRPPSIGTLITTTDSAYSGTPITLLAQDVVGTPTKVSFYRESNGTPGLQPTSDTALGMDSSSFDGWSCTTSPSALAGGTYTYYAVAADGFGNAGNAAQITHTIRPPGIGSLMTTADPAYSGSNITLLAQDVVGPTTKVTFYRETNGTPGLQVGQDNPLGSDTFASDGWSLVATTGGLAVGTYTYYAVASDSFGNVSNTAQATNTIRPPSIGSLTSTMDTTYSVGTISLMAQDVAGTGARVSFYRENNGVPGLQAGQDPFIGSDTSGSDGWSLVVSTNGFVFGTYTYYAVATDNFGNAGTPVQTTNTVRPPRVSLLTVGPGSAYAGTPLTLTAQGILGPATRVAFYRESNGTPGLQTVSDLQVGADTYGSDGWSAVVSTSGMSAGKYVYYAVATDAINNASDAAQTVGVIEPSIPVGPPSIGLLTDTPDPAFAGTPLTLTATDIQGSLTGVNFYRESNGAPGLQVGSDMLIGSDIIGVDGWSVVASTGNLAAGTYSYYAIPMEQAGTTASPAETTSTIIPPSIGSLAGTPDPVYSGTLITLTAQAVLGTATRVNFYRESSGTSGLQVGKDTFIGSDTNGVDGWSIVTSTSGIAIGSYTYYAVALDGFGNASNTVETPNTIQPPSVGSLTDAADPVYPGVPMTLVAHDVLGTATKVAFYRESNSISGLQPAQDILVGSDLNGTDGWSYVISATGMAAGTYTYYAVASDSFGNSGNTAATTNTIRPPSIGSLADTSDPAYSGLNVNLTAIGVLGPVIGVKFYREGNGTPGLQPTDTLLGQDTTGSDGWSWLASTGSLAGGTYTYYAVAADAFGNASNTVQTTNTLRPPSIGSLTANPDPNYSGIPVLLIAQDVLGSATRVNFYRESNSTPGLQTTSDIQVGADTSSSDGWWIATLSSGMAVGTYTYYAVALDGTGNASAAAQVTNTIRPPSVGSLAAAPDTVYASAPVTLVAQDVVGTATKVTFYRETNGILGLQAGSDAQVGQDTASSDGWSYAASTGGMSAGTYTYYAVAFDGFGNASNTVNTTNTIRLPNILLSQASVPENRPTGTVVGVLSTTDSDVGTTFTYSLASGTGSTNNASFTISGNQLLTAASFDYETASSYSIRIRSTDQGGLYADKIFTISVTNANDAPSVASFTRAVLFCGSLSFATADFSGSFSDQDPGDALVTVKVPALSAHGTLMLGGVPVTAGQEIAAAELSSLSYIPAVDFLGDDSFTWSASDGIAWAATPTTVHLSVGAPGGLLTVPTGTHCINVDLATLGTNVMLEVLPGAAVTLSTAQHLGGIHIQAGASVTMAAGAGVARTGSLLIDSGGQLDLCDNDLILDYSGTTPLTTIQLWLRNGAMGTGPSILMSTPALASGQPTASGLVDNALLHLTNWSGQTLTTSSNFSQLLIKHTYAGDTNLDGKVDQSDYLNIIANMGRSGAQWFEGDLNHDGIVTMDDFALVSQNTGAGENASAGPLLLAAPAAAKTKAATSTASAPVKKPAVSKHTPAIKAKANVKAKVVKRK